MKNKLIIFFTLLSIVSLILFFKFKQSFLSTKIQESKITLERLDETIAPKPTVILETGLPNIHLIKTAFIPQSPEHDWDQPWQDACEEAALLTVYYYYQNQNPNIQQIKDSILNMIDYEKKQSWSKDITLNQMALISKDYLSYTPLILKNPTLDDLKKYISSDTPIVVPANGKTLYQENKFFSSGGPWYHNLVILGYDDTKNKFTVHDVGTRHGAYFKYSYNVLIESIHDFPTSLKKEDIDQGEKSVLVLLKSKNEN